MKITIPANTKVLINGVTVAFAEDTEVDLPSAETIDEAVALSHIAELGAVFSHFDEEKGVNVVYRNGERVEVSQESVAPVVAENAGINEPEIPVFEKVELGETAPDGLPVAEVGEPGEAADAEAGNSGDDAASDEFEKEATVAE